MSSTGTESKDVAFDSIKTVVESLIPEIVDKTKSLMKDSLDKFLESRQKQITTEIDSKSKLAEKQFGEFLELIKKAAEIAQKAISVSADDAVKVILAEVSKVLKELGAPEDIQKLVDNLPRLLDAGKTIYTAFSDWRITKKELIAILISVSTIASLIVSLLS
jgi:hypothetical protein